MSSFGNRAWEPLTPEELQRLLPQCEITGLLGRGGMGAVYKGRQTKLDRDVAIKVLPKTCIGGEDDQRHFAERFLREAQAMAKLDHPAILSVYDFGETLEGHLYFVMEFIDGMDIQQYLRHHGGTLPEEHALAITAHVLDALAYAHSHGIIHRDIKPANVLLNREGRVKIADFGLAKRFGEGPDAADPGLTMSNVAVGTRDFIAPEALEAGDPVDHRADLYAVGVMLYQMLTGKLPRGNFELPRQIRPEIDPRLEKLVLKAMEADPDRRYASASAVRADLDAIMSEPLERAEAEMSSSRVPRAVPEMGTTSFRMVKRARRPPPRWGRRAGGQRFSTATIVFGIGLAAMLVIGMGLGWYWRFGGKGQEGIEVSDAKAKTSEGALVSQPAKSPATAAKVKPEWQIEAHPAEPVPSKPKPEPEPEPASRPKDSATEPELVMAKPPPEPGMKLEASATDSKLPPEPAPENPLETIPGFRQRMETWWTIGSEKIEALAANYTRGIDSRLGRAADAADLPLAKAWNEEKQRVEALRKAFAESSVAGAISSAGSVTFPELPELPEGSPAEVVALRGTWVTEQGKIRAGLIGKLQQSLDVLEAELTKAQDFQNAETVLAFRESLPGQEGSATAFGASPPPSKKSSTELVRAPKGLPAAKGIGTLRSGLTVESTKRWTTTGVKLIQGDLISVNQRGGRWTAAEPLGYCTINGYSNVPQRSQSYALKGNAPVGCLLGRINSGEPFALLDGKRVEAPETGSLSVCINNTTLNDNNGNVTIDIVKINP